MTARRSSAALGSSWERILESAHDKYRRDRVALILRACPPVKVLGPVRCGRFPAAWQGDGPPDFVGCVTATGQAILIDAKSTESIRWKFSNLVVHQAKDLEAAPSAIAGIALRMNLGTGYRAWFIPWTGIGPVWWDWKQGKTKLASLTVAHAGRIGYSFDSNTGDWLGEARRMGVPF